VRYISLSIKAEKHDTHPYDGRLYTNSNHFITYILSSNLHLTIVKRVFALLCLQCFLDIFVFLFTSFLLVREIGRPDTTAPKTCNLDRIPSPLNDQ
jgi:hypothetical protein